MHSLTICFGPAATTWTLLFKTEEKASELYNAYTGAKVAHESSQLIGVDDFGQTISLVVNDIHGMMLEDMSLSQEAAVERGLHQARTQAKAEKKAMEDSVIKEAIRAKQQGPAVYQPGMPNGRGF
jgi:NADH:ubiquinone oxidoreductase subunit D